jgi:hypothetical protein
MATSVCLLQTENRNNKLQYVSCKRKRKTKACLFGWQATIAVSAKVPVYAGRTKE